MPETRVGHVRQDSYDTYAGRGADGACFGEAPIGERGWLGNPFPLSRHNRRECIRLFRVAFERELGQSPRLRDAVRELHGDVLGCYCRGLEEREPACHADVIAEHADRLAREEVRADA